LIPSAAQGLQPEQQESNDDPRDLSRWSAGLHRRRRRHRRAHPGCCGRNCERHGHAQRGERDSWAQRLSNSARVDQKGSGNSAAVSQSGHWNWATIFQRGRGHSATVAQTGNNNAFGVFQFGRNTSMDAAQTGNGQAGLMLQYGW
jgi:hypothetical protein